MQRKQEYSKALEKFIFILYKYYRLKHAAFSLKTIVLYRNEANVITFHSQF